MLLKWNPISDGDLSGVPTNRSSNSHFRGVTKMVHSVGTLK
nr:MAG TPA: hypothetical protein [Caudoviricetes sp.]